MAVPHIQLNGVSRSFTSTNGATTQAIRKVTFDIQKHEFVAVIGPSGCGKSTLLRLISGLIAASSGDVLIHGAPVEKPSGNVGIVFQRPTLLPWLNVLSNVTFPVKHKRGHIKEAEHARALELISLVGLDGFAGNRPNELSGGMQQRAAIARALLLDPDILLMDEPFSALDALSRDEMSLELQRIWISQPKTVLFITHAISEALLLADRIVIMTPRPGTVLDVVDVTLPRPRTLETLSEPLYHELSTRIRNLLLSRSQKAA